MRFFVRSRMLFAGLALAALAGCAHYRLGPPAGPGFATIFVAVARNEAIVPQAAALVTAQTRTALARDGRLQLAAAPAAADAQLSVRLVSYEREIAAARHDDTGLARKYAVTLTAEITLVDHAGRKTLDRRRLQVRRDVFLDSGQQPTEYQTLPLLAEALATEIAHTVLDTW